MVQYYKNYITILLGFIVMWDTFTTIYGTILIIGSGGIQLFISILFSIIISALLLSTFHILSLKKSEYSIILKFLWGVALVYDIYSSYIGNNSLIIAENIRHGISQIMIVVGLSIFVCSAPIGISYLNNESFSN